MTGQQITGVKEALKELKDLEDGTINALRRNIRKYLADDIAAAYRYVQETEYSMVFGVNRAGMFHNGRTGYSTPNIKTSIRPKSRNAIVSIDGVNTNSHFGYEIMEKAGSRSSGRTASGRAMIGMLQKHFPPNKAGRFLFAAVQRRLGLISKDVAWIIEQYADKVNARLSSGSELTIISKAGQIF